MSAKRCPRRNFSSVSVRVRDRVRFGANFMTIYIYAFLRFTLIFLEIIQFLLTGLVKRCFIKS